MANKQAAITIIKQLNKAGFEALLAGGCVRDMLLCRSAKDYDVATSATPQQVIKLFKRTIKVGAKFGVIIVMQARRQVEVATFRSDDSYDDGRHPSGIKFVSAKEDAKRRDFTINGMFYDPVKESLIDYVNGRADLKKRIICTIGQPGKRFGEDYLRMLRAVRFSAQLGFEIAPATWRAVRRSAGNIVKISGERIAAELEGILTCPNSSDGAKMLLESGLAKIIFKDFSGKRAETGLAVLSHLKNNIGFTLALAALFSDWPSEFGIEKCKILKLSRLRQRHIKSLLNHRGALLNSDMPLSTLRKIATESYFNDLYKLQLAIQAAKFGTRRSITPLVEVKRRIKALGNIELKPKPLLDGHDLIRLGAKPGPGLGQLAEEMYIEQLEGRLQNISQAKKWADRWLAKNKEIR